MKLLLIGYEFNVVCSRSESERHGIPIAYLDLLQIDLDATVLAGGSIVNPAVAASTFPRILILLDL